MGDVLLETYPLHSWRSWDHEIPAFVVDFRERHRRAPNRLLVSAATRARMDEAVGGAPDPDDDEPSEGSALHSIVGPDYELACVVDARVPDGQVALAYDPDAAPAGGPFGPNG